MRLALKTSIPYFVKEGSIHFRRAGELTTLDDPDGSVLALLELLDGTRDGHQLSVELRSAHPQLTEDDVQQAIADLDELGFLQDASDEGSDFDAAARERWSNNLGFFEVYATLDTSKYEFQRRIRDAKVAVLGVGGIGSHVLIDLVAIGFEDIRIVDFDLIELSNFNRQILYGEPFLGQPKVDVAKQRALSLNSGVKLDAVQLKLESADDVYRVVQDREIVIAVVDRPKMQVGDWLNEGCVRAGVTLINGGVETLRAYYLTVVPGISGCLECWKSAVLATDPTSRMLYEELVSIERSGAAFGEQTAAFNGLVLFDAGYMVAEMVRLATRMCPPLSIGRQLQVTFHDPRLVEGETWKRDPDCPVCRDVEPKPEWEWLASGAGPLPF
jgi:molybdopterin/thiamine biosynthesis adenylyltransferase